MDKLVDMAPLVQPGAASSSHEVPAPADDEQKKQPGKKRSKRALWLDWLRLVTIAAGVVQYHGELRRGGGVRPGLCCRELGAKGPYAVHMDSSSEHVRPA